MFKKTAILSAALCCFAAAAEVETMEIKNDNAFNEVYGWWCANDGMMQHRPGGKIEKVPNGRSGSCMKITNTAKSFCGLYSRTLIPVDPKNDTFKFSIYVKGQGKFRFGFYSYAKDKKYVGGWMAPETLVNSKDWVKKDFVIPGGKLTGPVAFVRLSIEVNPGVADLSFDDFSGVKETRIPE